MMTFNGVGKELQSGVMRTLNDALGHIRGKVIDRSGRDLSGCTIWLQETGQFSYSDKKGNFVMVNIAPALYTIAIKHKGYFHIVLPDIPVEAGDNPGFRFIMHPCSAMTRSRENFQSIDSLLKKKESPYGVYHAS
jgi:hypothetical protein